VNSVPKERRMTRKLIAFCLSGCLALGLGVAAPAHGSPSVVSKKFANCAALNKVYPGGVAKNKSVQNKGGATKFTPSVRPKIYKANSSKDRDKDGIACER